MGDEREARPLLTFSLFRVSRHGRHADSEQFRLLHFNNAGIIIKFMSCNKKNLPRILFACLRVRRPCRPRIHTQFLRLFLFSGSAKSLTQHGSGAAGGVKWA